MASRYAKGMAASDESATPDELKERIEAGIPGSSAEVTGDGHHFNAIVSAPAFRGLSRIAQHRLVYDVFGRGGRRPHPRAVDSNDHLGNGAHRMSDDQTTQIREAIQSAISENPVILFMKGTPDQPMCGFSARTVAILQHVGTPFAAVNILPDPRIRQELSGLSNWPTIPQLFIDGEFVGGCDIVTEMYESGELQQALGVENGDGGEAGAEPAQPEPAPAPLTIENRL